MKTNIKKYSILLLCTLAICSLCIPLTASSSYASISDDAYKCLKGTWHSNSQPGYYAKFTKDSIKKYTKVNGKTHVYQIYKLVSAKKVKKGYVYKIKYGSSDYCYYHYTSSSRGEGLECFDDWNTRSGYSVSSSLYKIIKKPGKVKALKVKSKSKSINLKWKKVKRAKKYQIYFKYTNSFDQSGWFKFRTVKKNHCKITDGVWKNAKYKVKVRAVRYNKKGAFSKTKKFRTKFGATSDGL